jgi:hypothetical protein
MTSSGKMLAHVTTPARPPHNKTLSVSWVENAVGLVLLLSMPPEWTDDARRARREVMIWPPNS